MEAINKLDTNSFVIKDIHFSGSMTYRKCCFRLHAKKRQISCVVPKLLSVATQGLTSLHNAEPSRSTWSEHNNVVLKVLSRTAGHVCTTGYVPIVVVFSSKFQRHKFQSVYFVRTDLTYLAQLAVEFVKLPLWFGKIPQRRHCHFRYWSSILSMLG